MAFTTTITSYNSPASSLGPLPLPTRQAEIDEKVQYLMTKIQSTYAELDQVSLELRELSDIKSEDCSAKTKSLLEKKEALEKLVDANLNCKDYYEYRQREIHEKACIKALDRVSLFHQHYYARLWNLQRKETGDFNDTQSLIARAFNLFHGALMCSAIQDLYLEAMSKPCPNKAHWSGKHWPFVFSLNRPLQEYPGACDFNDRMITIDPNQPDDKVVGIFVFELTNAISNDQFHKLDLAAAQGQIDRESYAKEYERIEHTGVLRQRDIMRSAVREMGWNLGINIYRKFTEDFETYWLKIKNSNHAENYRKNWDAITIKANSRLK